MSPALLLLLLLLRLLLFFFPCVRSSGDRSRSPWSSTSPYDPLPSTGLSPRPWVPQFKSFGVKGSPSESTDSGSKAYRLRRGGTVARRVAPVMWFSRTLRRTPSVWVFSPYLQFRSRDSGPGDWSLPRDPSGWDTTTFLTLLFVIVVNSISDVNKTSRVRKSFRVSGFICHRRNRHLSISWIGSFRRGRGRVVPLVNDWEFTLSSRPLLNLRGTVSVSSTCPDPTPLLLPSVSVLRTL